MNAPRHPLAAPLALYYFEDEAAACPYSRDEAERAHKALTLAAQSVLTHASDMQDAGVEIVSGWTWPEILAPLMDVANGVPCHGGAEEYVDGDPFRAAADEAKRVAGKRYKALIARGDPPILAASIARKDGLARIARRAAEAQVRATNQLAHCERLMALAAAWDFQPE